MDDESMRRMLADLVGGTGPLLDPTDRVTVHGLEGPLTLTPLTGVPGCYAVSPDELDDLIRRQRRAAGLPTGPARPTKWVKGLPSDSGN